MPAQPLLVTSTTPSGSRRIRALFGDAVTHCYLPLDLPGPVRRFLDRVRPRLLIVMETEIWPQLFHRAKAPIVIANGRLSHASSTRYRAIAGWIRGALRRVHTVGVQSGDDRERFIRLGARPEHVEVTGNLKFDFTIEPADAEASAELRAAWGADRPVVVAGSTRGVEAELLASAWGRVLKHFPDALLVMAPRHPDSFDRAFASARAAGLATVRMTSLAARGRPDQCLIIDTLGDLLRCYGAGDLAFVGGTLAAVGGHNPLEPAAFGRPVLLGPNTRNLGDIADRLIECGGAVRIDDADGFAEQVIRLLSSPVQARQAGERARAMVESGRGATARTLDLIDSVLETPAHRRSGGRQEVTRATD